MLENGKQNFKILCAFVSLRLCVKKSFFVFTLLVLFSFVTLAQNDSAKTEARAMPDDFKSDNCSLFPDCDYGDCCVEHDKIYYFGGTSKERRQADKSLYKCVRAKKGFHHKIIAPLMYVGVRIGGVSWLPTPFRWGFGKDLQKKAKKKAEKQKTLNQQ